MCIKKCCDFLCCCYNFAKKNPQTTGEDSNTLKVKKVYMDSSHHYTPSMSHSITPADLKPLSKSEVYVRNCTSDIAPLRLKVDTLKVDTNQAMLMPSISLSTSLREEGLGKYYFIPHEGKPYFYCKINSDSMNSSANATEEEELRENILLAFKSEQAQRILNNAHKRHNPDPVVAPEIPASDNT